MLPATLLYLGTLDPLKAPLPLQAGPLSLVFAEGVTRSLRVEDNEVLRAVYVAIRGANWETISGRLSNISIERTRNSFHLEYESFHQRGEIDFVYKQKIVGRADGTVDWRMDGLARSSFLRNRIGFCILHPIEECAGRPCTIEKVDGTVQQAVFPKGISPHQPFLDLRAISHEIRPGVIAEVRFSGDVFETEDQRNWTDASYKTYSTPLHLDFPVKVESGSRIQQTVRLTLRGLPSNRSFSLPARVEKRPIVELRSVNSPPVKLPRLGLRIASHKIPLTSREVLLLRELRLAHLRTDLVLSDSGWRSALTRAIEEASLLGLPLEIALHTSDAKSRTQHRELSEIAETLTASSVEIARWLLDTQQGKSTWLRSIERGFTKVFVGTQANYAQLNRNRPQRDPTRGVCFSINPQVHAFDCQTMIENLAAQSYVVQDIRNWMPGASIAVSPVTLKPAFRPNETPLGGPVQQAEIPAQLDPRQMSLFGAGWTLGSVKALAAAGADSVTYYETTGSLGVMETIHGSHLPDKFPPLPGLVFPLYHVLADIGDFAGGELLASHSTHPHCIEGMVLQSESLRTVLIANLTREERLVQIAPELLSPELLSRPARCRKLDEWNAEVAMVEPERYRSVAGWELHIGEGLVEFRLPPYGFARIDVESGEQR